jgi:hypothetical protein
MTYILSASKILRVCMHRVAFWAQILNWNNRCIRLITGHLRIASSGSKIAKNEIKC